MKKDLESHLLSLKKYRHKLTRQQLLTLRGQILKGDIEAFKKGLNKLLRRKYEN